MILSFVILNFEEGSKYRKEYYNKRIPINTIPSRNCETITFFISDVYTVLLQLKFK